mgnify:CR=1 FL=1
MEMVQIKGVDSTVRDTKAHLKAGAKLIMTERLLTHGTQYARSDMDVYLDGEGASSQIISRSVAKDQSKQIFHPNAIGNAKCAAHVQCDSIIMDEATVSSIPAITANSADAQIVHEAAIGRINNDQLIKLMTFGMNEEEAEETAKKGRGCLIPLACAALVLLVMAGTMLGNWLSNGLGFGNDRSGNPDPKPGIETTVEDETKDPSIKNFGDPRDEKQVAERVDAIQTQLTDLGVVNPQTGVPYTDEELTAIIQYVNGAYLPGKEADAYTMVDETLNFYAGIISAPMVPGNHDLCLPENARVRKDIQECAPFDYSLLLMGDSYCYEVIEYFNEVCLDAEFSEGGNPSVLQKWTSPIAYELSGPYTDTDLAVLESFVQWLNTVEGFPGIAESQNPLMTNLRIYFGTQDEMVQHLGANFAGMDGGVTFWYEDNRIYDAIICYCSEIYQIIRNSVILEEIYNGLGPVQDTWLREDSIIFAGYSEPQSLTAVDELIIRLLYHPQMKCGMNAAECEAVIRQLYY